MEEATKWSKGCEEYWRSYAIIFTIKKKQTNPKLYIVKIKKIKKIKKNKTY
jgi:hypothetical protein